MTIRTHSSFAGLLYILFVLSSGLIGCGSGTSKPYPKPVGADKYVQGVLTYQSGNKDLAVEQFLAALRENPDLRMAHSYLGDIYRGENKWIDALPHYRALAQLDPYAISNHYNLGLSYQMLAMIKEAIPAYERGLEIFPDDVKSNMNLGLAYMTVGQFDDAEEKLRKATTLAPDNASAWSNLGVVLDAREKFVEAEAAYHRSLELDSSSLPTMQNLTVNLVSQDRAPDAVNMAERVIAREDTPANRRRYGDALAIAKRYDEALQQYAQALSANPRYFPALNGRADVFVRQYHDSLELDETKLAAAIKQYHDSLKIQPDQPRVVKLLQELEKPALFGK